MQDLLLIALMTAFFVAAVVLLHVCRHVVSAGSADEPGLEDPMALLAVFVAA
jgi:hypothetical protein